MYQCIAVRMKAPRARFAGADLTYADLSHAQVEGASFEGATFFRTVMHALRDGGADVGARRGVMPLDEERHKAEGWHARWPRAQA
jgi:hypothetical protein